MTINDRRGTVNLQPNFVVKFREVKRVLNWKVVVCLCLPLGMCFWSGQYAITTTASSCASKCENKKLNMQELARVVAQGRETLISKLHADYGKENFETMFFEPNNGTSNTQTPYPKVRGFSAQSADSLQRIKRRFQIKLLKMQTSLLESAAKKSNAKDCDCANDAVDDFDFIPYVLAVGGNSVAAGHGNLYNESYTAWFERDLQDIFQSVGIKVEGRNYGMSAMPSSPEISMCAEEIFGSDVDMLIWDFGMTDGRRAQPLFHFGVRGVRTSGFPSFLAFRVTPKDDKRQDILGTLDAMGAGVAAGDTTDIRAAVPDTAGRNSDEINAMPPYVRNMKCDSKIENGDPNCGVKKFTSYICEARRAKTGWHPGYKANALDGHALALFVLQIFLESINDLADIGKPQDREKLLRQLLEEENALQSRFLSADLPETLVNDIYKVGKGIVKDDLPDARRLFNGASFCHTARLPAQIRYLGYLTEKGGVGGVAIPGNETYDVGIEQADSILDTSTGKMRLAYNTFMQRDKRDNCPIVVKADYRDFFLTNQADGWTKLTVPHTPAEKEAYKYKPENFKGMIMICSARCDWERCKDEDLKGKHYAAGDYELTVNDIPVSSVVEFAEYCSILKNDDHGYYFPQNPQGEYEIGARVNATESYLRLSCIVVL